MDDGWMHGPSVNVSFGPHNMDLNILGSLLEPQEGSPHTVSSISHVDLNPNLDSTKTQLRRGPRSAFAFLAFTLSLYVASFANVLIGPGEHEGFLKPKKIHERALQTPGTAQMSQMLRLFSEIFSHE